MTGMRQAVTERAFALTATLPFAPVRSYAFKKHRFGRSSMRRGAWAAPLALAMMLQGAAAEQAGGNRPLDDRELLGMRLFNQSCRVCHTKPQMTSPLYGPELSRDSAGGQDTVMRDVISNGTPRMPGFKHHFEPAQIEAIVAYLRTIPPPPATAAPAR
jgi:mono/diheme cytochrome c family protein